MRKTIMILAILVCLGLVAGPAQADLVAISVNFTTAGNSLAAGDVAGNTAVVGSYASWNNMTSGTSLNDLNYSTGSASVADLAIWTGAPTTTGTNRWTGGVGIDTAYTPPISGSAADQKLMATGASTWATDGGANSGVDQFTLSSLATAFPNGYKVYIYQDAGNGTTGSTGFVQGNNSFSIDGGTTWNPATLVISTTALASASNRNPFNNDFTGSNHMRLPRPAVR